MSAPTKAPAKKKLIRVKKLSTLTQAESQDDKPQQILKATLEMMKNTRLHGMNSNITLLSAKKLQDLHNKK